MYFALIRLDTSRQLTVLFAKLRSLKKPSLYYIDRRRTGAFALVLPPVNDMTLNENDIGDMQVRFWGGHSSRLCDSRNWNVRETSLRRMILSIDCATSRYFDVRGLKARSSTIFMSKLFLGIELDRGRGKIYAKLRRRLVSTRRHTHDKALRSVPCIPGFYPRPTRASHGNMYEKETFLFSLICANCSYID